MKKEKLYVRCYPYTGKWYAASGPYAYLSGQELHMSNPDYFNTAEDAVAAARSAGYGAEVVKE